MTEMWKDALRLLGALHEQEVELMRAEVDNPADRQQVRSLLAETKYLTTCVQAALEYASSARKYPQLREISTLLDDLESNSGGVINQGELLRRQKLLVEGAKQLSSDIGPVDLLPPLPTAPPVKKQGK